MLNKVALTTGAADLIGIGIGFACAKAIAEKGAKVVITDLPSRQKELDEAVFQLGEHAMGLTLDVTDDAEVRNFIALTEMEGSRS